MEADQSTHPPMRSSRRGARRALGRVAANILAVSMIGCLGPGLVPCGDLLCPTGTTCVAGTLCASTEQIAACEGASDGSTCSVGGAVGRCELGVCQPAGCGNLIVDPEEACDDGNQDSGDGCRADCRKVEVCGDGIVDDGEGCDDSNANPVDRCDGCAPTTWRTTVVIGGNADATTVGLALPVGVAVDGLGNVYIADQDSHRVWRIDVSGTSTTLAGNGTSGLSGDGGAATSAQLSYPAGVAVDELGNVFISDSGNHRVRRIDATGVITTFAGTASGFAGDGGLAISARLYTPLGLAIDGLGSVYIADLGNRRVRRVDTAGIITTIAGIGSVGSSGDGGPATGAELRGPYGVAVAGDGNIYIADSSDHRIRRIDALGIISTFAGTGTAGLSGDSGLATGAQLFYPDGVAVDTLGRVYIADNYNHRIRRVDAGVITTIAGTGAGFSGDGGAATAAKLDRPGAVAIDALGTIFIADTANHRIRRVAAGTITTVAGTGAAGISGDGGAATSVELGVPEGVAVGTMGDFYIADTWHHRIRRVDSAGVVTTVAGNGAEGFAGDGGAATSAEFAYPASVAVDMLGNLYVSDSDNNRVRRVDAAGVVTTFAGTGAFGAAGDGGSATSAQLANPHGLAVDALGNVYIADRNNHRIRRVDAGGIITTVAGTVAGFAGDGAAATSARLNLPEGVAFDDTGNLFVADTSNHRVRRVSAAGVITTISGSVAGFTGDGGPATAAQLNFPRSVTIDALTRIYIADSSNRRIRRIDAAGMITTFAGNGGPFGGDGGGASDAGFGQPTAVTLDGLGNVYVADNDGGAIRRIDAAGILTVAGAIDPEGMGPVLQARLADPRALQVTPSIRWFAGGTSGTVQALRSDTAWLEAAIGRYPQPAPVGVRARFRDQTFGDVTGLAYDATARLLYVSESSRNRIDVVTLVDPDAPQSWTITPLANVAGTAGFADGAAAAALFRAPGGLFLDEAAHQLYVADTGNHVVRFIDLSAGVAGAIVRTVAGGPATRGYRGDGAVATAALLYEPGAVTRCGNGDLFIADTRNHRVRRVAAVDGTIATVLGVGVPTSSGDGTPATTFPVDAPLGLACDATGNLFVSSTTTVRLLPADASGVVDGTGSVQTIYGPPDSSFPASVTRCLTGIAVVDATTIEVTDSCTGLLVRLERELR